MRPGLATTQRQLARQWREAASAGLLGLSRFETFPSNRETRMLCFFTVLSGDPEAETGAHLGTWDNYRKIIESIKSGQQRPMRRLNSKGKMLGNLSTGKSVEASHWLERKVGNKTGQDFQPVSLLPNCTTVGWEVSQATAQPPPKAAEGQRWNMEGGLERWRSSCDLQQESHAPCFPMGRAPSSPGCCLCGDISVPALPWVGGGRLAGCLFSKGCYRMHLYTAHASLLFQPLPPNDSPTYSVLPNAL